MKPKDVYAEKMEAQLKEWRAQLDLLAAKIENAGADVKIKWSEELDDLRATHNAASEKLQEIREASDDAWEKTKETADKVWAELKRGLADAASQFK